MHPIERNVQQISKTFSSTLVISNNIILNIFKIKPKRNNKLNEMSKYDTYEHPRLCFEGQALEMLKNLNFS